MFRGVVRPRATIATICTTTSALRELFMTRARTRTARTNSRHRLPLFIRRFEHSSKCAAIRRADAAVVRAQWRHIRRIDQRFPLVRPLRHPRRLWPRNVGSWRSSRHISPQLIPSLPFRRPFTTRMFACNGFRQRPQRWSSISRRKSQCVTKSCLSESL